MTRRDPGTKPAYVVHEIDERSVTVDWFFGSGRWGRKLWQLLLLLVAWFFAVLPIYVTVDSLVHWNDPGEGVWSYAEGFEMFRVTMVLLAVIAVIFTVGFLVLYLCDRTGRRERESRITYDEERLGQRLAVADHWYADKFGPAQARGEERTVTVEPYGDLGTYELRDQYRSFEID